MIRCLAIDDSPLALDIIEDYIRRTGQLQLVHRCTNAIEASGILRKEKIDLLFLDIQMPDVNGIDLLKSLSHKPLVIFTTSYPAYALEGFNLDAVDYLLKPFSYERFYKAVEKATKLISIDTDKDARYVFIRSGYEDEKVFIRDLLYVEALRDYAQFVTPAKKIMSLMSMKDVLQLLPSGEFARIHRSFIVSLNKIIRITSRSVFIGEKELPVGKIFQDELKHFLASRELRR